MLLWWQGKKKKKPFIDKKNAHSYTLVHRSQRDPLVVDEEAPQLLLKPLNEWVCSDSLCVQVMFDSSLSWSDQVLHT